MKFKGKKSIIAAALFAIVAAGSFSTVASAEKAEHDIVLNISHRTEGADGTVSINKTKASEGDAITIIATPNPGCMIKQITMFYGDTSILDGGETTKQHVVPFQMPDATVYVNITWDFALDPTPTPDPIPAPTWEKGDANCDGRVTAADATAVLKHLVGSITLSNQGYKNADMDDSGNITAADATAILKLLVSKS
ncbi:MAG: dockerin type I repeat-containing protein [Oscillospiraceae bacterium]|nr:dockerin type I repeat-containing protein [Oscillospiraceae bacterium]